MNKTFQEVAAAYRVVQTLSHAQQVTRMYRRALRTLDSWAIDRELFNEEATKIRAKFDANKALPATSGYVSEDGTQVSSTAAAFLAFVCAITVFVCSFCFTINHAGLLSV
jgi:hypothetical protein